MVELGWEFIIVASCFFLLVCLMLVFMNYRGQVGDVLKDSLKLLLKISPTFVYFTFTLGIIIPMIMLLMKIIGLFIEEEYSFMFIFFVFHLMFVYLKEEYKIVRNGVVIGMIVLNFYQFLYHKEDVLTLFLMCVSSYLMLRTCKSKITNIDFS